MERALRRVTGVMAVTATSALALAAWGYVEIDSGPACPDTQETAVLCVMSAFDGLVYTAAFDSESFEAQDTSTLLAGMLTASAAILAISFTVNQVMLSGISQRYSSRLVESYAKKPAVSFAAFVLMVAGSAALLIVHNSPYAWIGAYFAWGLTAGFFAALWFFAREFMHMMRVISPYSFIEDAKKKILAGMKGSRGAPAQPMNEEQFQSLARSLGDAAVKSIASNDEDICIACIEALSDVGKVGLSKDGTDKDAAEVGQRDLTDKIRACFAASVLARIFRDSARTEDTPATSMILKKFSNMAALAMHHKSNEPIMGILYDKDDTNGSLNWQAIERLAGAGGKYDKHSAILHLEALPSTAAMAGWYMPSVEQFVRYHVFRSVMVIIDKDDFELFKEVIDAFSKGFFGRMENMKSSIADQIFRSCSGRQDLAARRDEILFELEHATKIDFGRILELKKKIWDLLAQTDPDVSANPSKALDQLYVYSLLCGTFFRIACHIMGKGDEYAAYLRKLWYHASPDGRLGRSAGMPPCPKDVDWNSAYAAWRGQAGLGRFELADDPGTYEPHYHEYAVLHMLREGRIFTVPTEEDAAKWASRGQYYALEHHYDNMDEMRAEPFLAALASLAGSELPAAVLPVQDVPARIKRIREELGRYKDGRQCLMDALVHQMPVDDEKIAEWKDRACAAYAKNSQARAMGRIRYDARLRGDDVVVDGDMPIRALCRKGYTALDGQLGIDGAEAEFKEILEAADGGAVHVRADPGNLRESVRACVERMRDGGHNPSVALVSADHQIQMPETYSANAIEAGGPPIPIVEVPWNVPDTWILDPDCVEITYGAENEAGRMRLDMQDADESAAVTMTATIRLSVRILDGGGVARIASGEA